MRDFLVEYYNLVIFVFNNLYIPPLYPNLMKLFIWDFHGVLEKGNENAVLEISNEVLKKAGYKERFTINDCRVLYGKKWYEYFEYLLPYESHEKHMDLQEDCFMYQRANPKIIVKYIEPNDHVYEVLNKIHNSKNHHQILISNTMPDDIPPFLDSIKVSHYFEGKAFAADMHHQSDISKKDILKQYLKGKDIKKIVIIDDSPGNVDILSAADGIETVFYYYLHPEINFKECNVDYKIHDLREVLREL